MSLVHSLSPLAARHSLSFTASPVRGKPNLIADSLSRFQFQHFRLLAPYADSIPTQVPRQLLSNLDLFCQINATSTWLSCGVSNVTKAQISVSANPSQLSWCTLFSNPWTSLTTTVQCFGLPAVSGFLVSYAQVSSLSTSTSIPTSTLLSAMPKQIL